MNNKEDCIDMWVWLSEHPSKIKAEYFEENKIEHEPPYECYACAEVKERSNGYGICPINWIGDKGRECTLGTGYGDCVHKSSPYYKWQDSYTAKEHSLYAEEIVQLIKDTWED